MCRSDPVLSGNGSVMTTGEVKVTNKLSANKLQLMIYYLPDITMLNIFLLPVLFILCVFDAESDSYWKRTAAKPRCSFFINSWSVMIFLHQKILFHLFGFDVNLPFHIHALLLQATIIWILKLLVLSYCLPCGFFIIIFNDHVGELDHLIDSFISDL